jgi:dTDP-4-amino-4,6-dideoxygalactose transaminase
MTVPMIDLGRLLADTKPGWRKYLTEMHRRKQFVLGDQVRCFEMEFAVSVQAKCAIGVGSGTSAIELCLRAAGIASRSQEVLTPALTSPFTAQAILAAGATPRFTDVSPDTLHMDPLDAEARLTKRTVALLPVHLYGQACDLERLTGLARLKGLLVVQDACQAHGASYHRRPLTEFSPYTAYSFYPTKNLGCLGDGGAIATSRLAVATRLRMLRDGGRQGDQVSHMPAVNSRLDELQACYLRAFVPHLAEWNARRAHLARIYDVALKDCPGVQPVRRWPCSVNHLYVIRVARRDQLRQCLLQQGIQTGVHYPVPLHLQPAFRMAGMSRGSLPHAERACRQIMSLPLWPYLSDSQVSYVGRRIRSFYR